MPGGASCVAGTLRPPSTIAVNPPRSTRWARARRTGSANGLPSVTRSPSTAEAWHAVHEEPHRRVAGERVEGLPGRHLRDVGRSLSHRLRARRRVRLPAEQGARPARPAAPVPVEPGELDQVRPEAHDAVGSGADRLVGRVRARHHQHRRELVQQQRRGLAGAQLDRERPGTVTPSSVGATKRIEVGRRQAALDRPRDVLGREAPAVAEAHVLTELQPEGARVRVRPGRRERRSLSVPAASSRTSGSYTFREQSLRPVARSAAGRRWPRGTA